MDHFQGLTPLLKVNWPTNSDHRNDGPELDIGLVTEILMVDLFERSDADIEFLTQGSCSKEMSGNEKGTITGQGGGSWNIQ